MNCLLDTNVLLRLINTDDPQHDLVSHALDILIEHGYILPITPQVLIEFFVVATRPVNVNGFGWEPQDAHRKVLDLIATFAMTDDTKLIFGNWLQIVQAQGVSGKRAHDARLVAVMISYGINHILTLNIGDFKSFPGIQAFHPADIVESSSDATYSDPQ